ncbi:MAG: family 16 glycoside hydrolase [Planctomycetota bacterium]
MIKRLVLAMLLVGLACPLTLAADEGWIELLKIDKGEMVGWKKTENQGTWIVTDGMYVTQGPRSHLFYVGPVENANFKNFELKVEMKTEEGSNSGIYFHTEVHESGWPPKGYEVQVNYSHRDKRKTGGLYAVQDVEKEQLDGYIKDKEWYTQHIIVEGKNIKIRVKSEKKDKWLTTVDWTETPDYAKKKDPARKLSSGTFALQGHDPKSVVYYRSVKVKPLPPRLTGPLKVAVLTGGHGFQQKPFTEMFKSKPFTDKKIEAVEIKLKDDSEIFEDISGWDYDVIVMYNMTQKISKKRQDNFKELLDRGIGFVSLHHNMGAFQNWPEFLKIAGGKYQLQAIKEGKMEIRKSTYKHDIDLEVKVVDKKHPVTRGLKDFKIHDEGYKYCRFEKDNHVLLTTDHPDCDKTVAWISKYKDAKICGIMLGHDGKAYANPAFRKLLSQAILWTGGRLK